MEKPVSPWSFVALIVLTLAVRVAVILPALDSFGDDDSYGRLAIACVAHHKYGFPLDPNNPVEVRPTAYRPPLYPLLLTLAVVDGRINPYIVAVMHVIFGLATVIIVYEVAKRLTLRAAWVPALAVALDPILLRGSQLLMTETLVTFWAVSAWLLYLSLVRPSLSIGRPMLGSSAGMWVAMLLGLVLGLAVLTRPTMLPWAVLSIVTLSLRTSEAGNRVALVTAALLMLAALNVGWLVRNKVELGEPILMTTHGGYTLLLANNPSIYRHFVEKGPDRNWDDREFQSDWDKLRRGEISIDTFLGSKNKDEKIKSKSTAESHELPELAEDRIANAAARKLITTQGSTFALSCLYRAGWLWAVYPNQLRTNAVGPATVVKPAGPSITVIDAYRSASDEKAKDFLKFCSDEHPPEHMAESESKSESEPAQQHSATQARDQGLLAKLNDYMEKVWRNPAEALSLAIGVWYSCWFLMALLGTVRLWDAWTSRVWLMPLLLVLSITAIHAVYWSNMRMRAPLMPIVYMVACWPLMRERTPSRTLG